MGSICSSIAETPSKATEINCKVENLNKPTQTSFIFTSEQDLPEDYVRLAKEINFMRAAHKKAMLSKLLKYMRRALNASISTYWNRWKDFLILNAQDLSQNLDNYVFDENEDIEFNEKLVEEARVIINYDNQIVLNQSPLLPYINLTKSNEQPMSLTLLFRFFEEMMDKKYETDVLNLSLNRVLTSIPDFFIEHNNRVYGLKKIASKNISQILLSLRDLYMQNHSYGKIICRLLQIYDPQPIPTELAIFLTKARHEVNKIITAKKQGTKTNKMIDEIHISEAINLIHSLFDTDKFSRAKAILLLKPKIMSDDEFFLYRISQKIIRLGLTSEIIFSMVDSSGSGSVLTSALIDHLKKTLDTSFPGQDSDIVLRVLDPKSSSSVSQSYFLQKVSLKTYSEHNKNEKLTVTKSNFINIMTDVYNIVQIKDTAVLTSLFKKFKKAKVVQSEFAELVTQLDSKLTSDQAASLYERALILNSDCSLDGVLLDAFIKIVFKNCIGRRGVRDFSKIHTVISCENIELKTSPSKEAETEKAKTPSASLKKGSTFTFDRQPGPRRRSNVGMETEKSKLTRGYTPVDKERSKSPIFGRKPN